MTFLQPWLLWGLPLLALPIIIHLLNRVRYRSLDWAAMSFLLSASRRSSRQARLRHWLILLCRALGIAALVLALARPLAGGWLGWALHGAPDTVILLLDRSASMETREAGGDVTKRERALGRFAEAARQSAGTARFVLIDSATLLPQEIAGTGVLPELSVAGPTDTAADLPALLAAAVEYIQAAQAGHTEIWLASDLQRSNWQPDNPRWSELTERLRALPQQVRVRVLALTGEGGDDVAVRLEETRRAGPGGDPRLLLTVELTRRSTTPAAFPLTVAVEGARAPVDVRMDGAHVVLQHAIDLGDRTSGGWGCVELPTDANQRDNRAWFAFNPALHLHALVVTDDAVTGRLLELASAPAPALMNQSAATVPTASFDQTDLAETALIVWHAPWPDGERRTKLEQFLQQGGVVLAFAPGRLDAQFGEPAAAKDETPFRVTNWNTADGLLAKTADGKELAVSELAVLRRQSPTGEWSVLGAFADGQTFLGRRQVGAGRLYACATSPATAWSTLGEGLVLVPMLQRALQEGGRRLGSVIYANCGDQQFAKAAANWKRADESAGETRSEIAFHQAGVYQDGNRWIVLNRPATEDERETIDEPGVRGLFGAVSLRFFEEKGADANRLQSEVWRLFLWAMLLFLVGEALLAMPGAHKTAEVGRPTVRRSEPEPVSEGVS